MRDLLCRVSYSAARFTARNIYQWCTEGQPGTTYAAIVATQFLKTLFDTSNGRTLCQGARL